MFILLVVSQCFVILQVLITKINLLPYYLFIYLFIYIDIFFLGGGWGDSNRCMDV